MKRYLLIALASLAALPLAAQAPAAAAAAQDDGKKVVAVVNGEAITRARLDQLWERAGQQMRSQYEQNGGKSAFLENYISKRLMIQEARKAKFDQRPEVVAELEAARESALFDRYVRDVVSESIVSEAAIRKYYDENKDQFSMPERAKLRHIILNNTQAGANPRTKEQSLELMKKIAAELGRPTDRTPAGTQAFLTRFAAAAAKYSEDATAQSGGDLGWTERGYLDATLDQAAFSVPVGMLSGIVETPFGLHLIFVEDRKAATTESFEDARPAIREFLMAQNATSVVERLNRLTGELKANSNITVFPENVQ
ncbi:MAG TPA: peptidylprolyl isomerase [Thermoanaerobaculia bacterium]|jgi:peptidyl-prolyl cis-trans isomerase C